MNKLRTLRKQAGVSVSELAIGMGASESAVIAWERNRRGLSPEKGRSALRFLALHGVYATLDNLYVDLPEQAA